MNRIEVGSASSKATARPPLRSAVKNISHPQRVTPSPVAEEKAGLAVASRPGERWWKPARWMTSPRSVVARCMVTSGPEPGTALRVSPALVVARMGVEVLSRAIRRDPTSRICGAFGRAPVPLRRPSSRRATSRPMRAPVHRHRRQRRAPCAPSAAQVAEADHGHVSPGLAMPRALASYSDTRGEQIRRAEECVDAGVPLLQQSARAPRAPVPSVRRRPEDDLCRPAACPRSRKTAHEPLARRTCARWSSAIDQREACRRPRLEEVLRGRAADLLVGEARPACRSGVGREVPRLHHRDVRLARAQPADARASAPRRSARSRRAGARITV